MLLQLIVSKAFLWGGALTVHSRLCRESLLQHHNLTVWDRKSCAVSCENQGLILATQTEGKIHLRSLQKQIIAGIRKSVTYWVESSVFRKKLVHLNHAFLIIGWYDLGLEETRRSSRSALRQKAGFSTCQNLLWRTYKKELESSLIALTKIALTF